VVMPDWEGAGGFPQTAGPFRYDTLGCVRSQSRSASVSF
jgi:hypothetical protein